MNTNVRKLLDNCRPPRWTERGITASLLLAVAVPFWSGRFLPFLDLPQHLALSAAIARYADRSTGFATYYHIDWRITPYWGFYTGMHALMAFGFDALAASRVLFTVYAVSLPLAAGYLLTSLGRDWRYAAFTLPLVYNTNLFFGFAGFVLSVPLFLYALALAVRTFAAVDPVQSDEWRLAGAAALVYLFHVQSYLLLGACVTTLLALHWTGVRWAVRRTVPFALSLLLFLPWVYRGFVAPGIVRRNSGAFGAGLNTRYEPIGDVLSKIPERLLGVYNDGSDSKIAAALLVVFLVALVLTGGPLSRQLRAALIERRGEVLTLLLFVSYVVAPFEIAGQWYVGPRHLIFAALLAPTCLVAPATGFRRCLVVLACALGLWASANARAKVGAFQDQVGPFADVLDKMEPGKRVMNLMFDDGATGPVRYWPFLHWSCYYQAVKGGDVSFSFAGLPHTLIAATAIPVTYRRGYQPPPHSDNPRNFHWDEIGPAFDYFLIHGRPSGDAAHLADHADLVVQAADWQLWRRR